MSQRQLDAAVKRVLSSGKPAASPAARLMTAQLGAFLALVFAVLMVSLAPVVVTGIMGRVVPDSLIAVSDKTVTGLIGVLGALVTAMWRSLSRPSDEAASGKPGDPVHMKEDEA